MVASPQEDDEHFVIATREAKGAYAMVYFPTGAPTDLDFSDLKGKKFKAHWFDPRTGVSFPYAGPQMVKGKNSITPPSSGKGNDWVLIVEKK